MLRSITIILLLLQICSDASAQDLDYSFGVKGIVNMPYDTFKYHSEEIFYGVAQQTDGKIIAAGSDFTVIRYHINGMVDSTFAINGKLRKVFGTMSESANTAIIQPDGKILVSGTVWVNGNANFAIIRLRPDGSLDSTFSQDGRNIIDISGQDACGGMSLQPDGKIILCGSIKSSDSVIILRLNSDGTLDSTFNNHKVFFIYGASNSWTMGLNAVTIKPDGKILACGNLNPVSREFSLIQLLPNGELDSTFGNHGIVTTANTGVANNIALQTDGKIIIGGIGIATGGGYIIRYMPNGIIDSSFGVKGRVLITHSLGFTLFEDVEIDKNGKIYATGQITNNICYQGDDMLLMRFNIDGSIDTDYAPNGIITKASKYSEGTYGMLIQQDGRILAVGYAKVDPASKQFCMLRYWPYPLSSDDIENTKTQINIFPNPASDVLYLDNNSNELNSFNYIVTDITGQTIQEGIISDRKINISNIPNGLYMLRIFNKESTIKCYTRFTKN